ncbi:hypothetical protein D5R40_33740 [Okeania hirsuta]|uniref:Uncharacterized protein n=1 Tax=Okeania hirsuta TaxID=1458930 RepID=A0A3N6NLW2_9CYAN|nr:hypothetical protein [Okeania hirsuta]RQH16830.1 hypothetical protein D5R40_33740 [Okeania hirsuta]
MVASVEQKIIVEDWEYAVEHPEGLVDEDIQFGFKLINNREQQCYYSYLYVEIGLVFEMVNKGKPGIHRTVDAAIEYLMSLADYVVRVHRIIRLVPVKLCV